MIEHTFAVVSRCRVVTVVASVFLAGLLMGGCAGPSNELGWMTGRWSGSAWGGTLNAEYFPWDDGVVGYSELLHGGELSHYEFEVFRAGPGATLTPFPGGKRSATFELVERGPKFAVFENREKDFPTRIEYAVEGDRLVIVLSDPVGEPGKVERFEFDRVGSTGG